MDIALAPKPQYHSAVVQTRSLTKADFDKIVEVFDEWWGGPSSGFAPHPIYFYEFGEHALVAEVEGELVGFLFGFIAERPVRTGYVQLVGIHPEHRRKGVGRLLYEKFTQACQKAGCERMKAITTAANEGSLRFHEALGWAAEEVEDYAGPGRRRIVFTRALR
jgi:GNAT superfamily N-acetyltransferase